MASKTSVEWKEGRLRYINQVSLPHDELYVETADYRVVAESIKKLEIRGAPAIGVAAAFAVVLAVPPSGSGESSASSVARAIDHLSRTRPTAVNLFSSLERMRNAYESVKGAAAEQVYAILLEEAQAIDREERDASRRIGRFGVTLLKKESKLLTHCNTGELAAPGGGTALNIIIEGAKKGLVRQVFVDETRPLFQGARLTTWELQQNNVTAVLITDSTAGSLMKDGSVDAVFVGADRIARNGDVANKIGTYSLAVLASHHDVPFYVAAPTTTIDPETASGEDIPIEVRSGEEVTHPMGVRTAPASTSVFAPAFDVTPHSLVTAIVTDAGIVYPPYEREIQKILKVSTETMSSI